MIGRRFSKKKKRTSNIEEEGKVRTGLLCFKRHSLLCCHLNEVWLGSLGGKRKEDTAGPGVKTIWKPPGSTLSYKYPPFT